LEKVDAGRWKWDFHACGPPRRLSAGKEEEGVIQSFGGVLELEKVSDRRKNPAKHDQGARWNGLTDTKMP